VAACIWSMTISEPAQTLPMISAELAPASACQPLERKPNCTRSGWPCRRIRPATASA
jgi:hypothetical protein